MLSHDINSTIEANRPNSDKSPRTEAGTQRSARSALRHGLTAETVVLPLEDLDARAWATPASPFQMKRATNGLLISTRLGATLSAACTVCVSENTALIRPTN